MTARNKNETFILVLILRMYLTLKFENDLGNDLLTI